jgi:UDP-2,3-diacylglucosamine pyrophosphatase LpxH
VKRTLADDTLLVFLSDCHIGGSDGRDIFESPDDLTQLFDNLGGHSGPIELVLAGDFFDFLRVARVPDGENRASMTMARPEYQALFAALRRFAAGEKRTVIYLPGNHDAEAWWNREIQAELKRAGLVHEFALAYAASFQSEPSRLVYCEHGNEFDPENTISDYNDPLDTPLGSHIVTDIIPRLPSGRAADALQLREVDHVFPLATIPAWVAGRLFYTLVTEAVRWLLFPLLIAYAAYKAISFVVGHGAGAINELFVDVAYDVVLLLLAFGLFFFVARRMADRAIRSTPARLRPVGEPGQPAMVDLIRRRLESGQPLPLSGALPAEIAVFVSGHTHAPSLTEFKSGSGRRGVLVNSGCWLRQLQSLRTHLRAPTVFVSRFVQTHVRIYRDGRAIQVQLWDHPRASAQRLRIVERLAVLGRLPAEPEESASPRVRASASVSDVVVGPAGRTAGTRRPLTTHIC